MRGEGSQMDLHAMWSFFLWLRTLPHALFIRMTECSTGGGLEGAQTARGISLPTCSYLSLVGGCVCAFRFSKPKCILEMYHWPLCKQTDESMNGIKPQRF